MTIAEIIKLWKKDKKQYVKQSSMAAYSLLVSNHIEPEFGHLNNIDEKDVQSFALRKIDGGLSKKSVTDIIVLIKMITRFGVKNKWLEPCQYDIQFPTQRSKPSIEVLSKSEHKKIMDYVNDNFSFRNLGIYMCLSTGLRIGEVCALTWEDIDIDKGLVKVRRTIQRVYIDKEDRQITESGRIKKTEIIFDDPKTKNSVRDIPMSKQLLAMVKPLKKVVNGSCFILTNDAKPTEPRTYRIYYEGLMTQLGIAALNFHGLRHTFATRCIESKCDVKTVSVLLGHSNVSTTLNLYVHPNMEQKQNVIDQMMKSLK